MRVGFAGTGRMASAHALALSQLPEVAIAAAAGGDFARAESFARKWGGRAYRTYGEMLEEAALDAVYLCTPAPLHAEQGIAAAEAGLAIYLEKPAAWDLGQAVSLEEAVRRTGAFCQVGYQLRYHASVDRARELVGGQPVSLVRHHRYWTLPVAASIRDRRTGGGQIFDQVTHEIDLARRIVGEIETVRAEYTLNARRGEFDNWDGYAVLARFSGGAVGVFSSTYALFPEVEEPPTLDIVIREKLLRLTPSGLTVRSPSGVESVDNSGSEDADAVFVAAWKAGDRSRLLSPVEDAVRTLAVTLAANQAAESGETVRVDALLERARRGAR